MQAVLTAEAAVHTLHMLHKLAFTADSQTTVKVRHSKLGCSIFVCCCTTSSLQQPKPVSMGKLLSSSQSLCNHSFSHLKETSDVGTSLQGGVILLGCLLTCLVDVLHDVLHQFKIYVSERVLAVPQGKQTGVSTLTMTLQCHQQMRKVSWSSSVLVDQMGLYSRLIPCAMMLTVSTTFIPTR